MDKSEVIEYLRQVSIAIASLTLLVLPVFFLTNTTEIFVFPKQILLTFSTIVLIILFVVKTVLEKKITVRSSPLNLPILLFGIAVLLSSIFSRNMYDSLLQTIPLLFILVFFFLLMNLIADRTSFRVILFSLLLGGALTSIISILQLLKIYVFPSNFTQQVAFNTFGSSIQEVMYLASLLFLVILYLLRLLRVTKPFDLAKFSYDGWVHLVSGVFMLFGFGISIFHILKAFPQQKPILLPFAHGLQIGMAAISQDTQRILLSLLFGSGYGTFSTVFTRFKTTSFNLEKDIWNLVFSYSSNYFLELVPTIGLVGSLLFLWIAFKLLKIEKKARNVLYVSTLFVFLLSLLLPFSFTMVFLLFSLCALYISSLYLEKTHHSVYNVTLTLVAMSQGLISFESTLTPVEKRSENSSLLPIIVGAVLLSLSAFVGFFSAKLLLSDLKFRESLEQSALANGNKTYNLQREALSEFPYRSDYYRIFSQVNLALANSVANSIPQNATPSADTRNTLVALIRQSIDSARAASILAPASAVSWQNLSQVYKSLINVGQNAEQFAVVTIQQAIALDPYNPNLYVELGGIFFQLRDYERAQQQFQIAVNLKQDFANAYYNLGHTLEAKGNREQALTQYRTVRELVRNNKDSLDKISAEIASLEKSLGQAEKVEEPTVAPVENQPPLEISTPSGKLPPQKPQVQIPPPPHTSTSPTAKTTPTPTAQPTPLIP